jgi:hypothetical protein
MTARMQTGELPACWWSLPQVLIRALRVLRTRRCTPSSFTRLRLASDIPKTVHSRLDASTAPSDPTLPHAKPCSIHVVSHHLDGLLRSWGTGVLHPESGQGSLRFAVRHPPLPKKWPVSAWSPQRGHPSKNSPRQQPFHVTVVVAFLWFDACPRTEVQHPCLAPSPTKVGESPNQPRDQSRNPARDIEHPPHLRSHHPTQQAAQRSLNHRTRSLHTASCVRPPRATSDIHPPSPEALARFDPCAPAPEDADAACLRPCSTPRDDAAALCLGHGLVRSFPPPKR